MNLVMRLLVLAVMWVLSTSAQASTCTTRTKGTLTCGATPLTGRLQTKSGTSMSYVDPSSFSSYTCTTVQPPGPLVPQAGPDAIYKYVCPSTGNVTIKLDNVDCEFDLFVLNSGCTGTGCVFGSETPRPELGEELTFNCVNGQTYWIVAEGYELWYDPLGGGCTAAGITLIPPSITYESTYRVQADCAERCDNGTDDDGDGKTDCLDTDCIGSAVCCDADGDGHDAIGGTCLGDDCDDGNPGRYPGKLEVPVDGIDQDCDLVDSCYRDFDGDGYGGTTVIDGPSLTCPSGSGGVSRNDDDCNDTGGGALIHPGATEVVADGVDQDCDGVDRCWRDQDGDGYGSSVSTTGPDLSCAGEPGLAAVSGDCQDTGAGASSIKPGAPEVCDGLDNDCDTAIDDADVGLTGAPMWYRDADGDGFGSASSTRAACLQPSGYLASSTDCADTGVGASAIYPGAPEIPADGVDQDCDLRDHCYVDLDRDTYGTSTASAGDDLICGNKPGESTVSTDCLDTGTGAAAIHPGAAEVCDTLDNDCDALIDDADPGRTGGTVWYLDADGDTYAGSATTVTRCTRPSGYYASATDCKDTGPGAASYYPGATEIPADGLDQDCDGKDHCYVDADLDTYGTTAVAAGDDLVCGNKPGESTRSTDCVDSGPGASAINPGAAEICDTLDNDCDTLVDDADPGRTGGSTWYFDADGDGYAGSATTLTRCTQPPGYSATATDCRDTGAGAAAVYPGAPEIPADGFDQDCDGKDHCYVDADLDTYGTTAVAAGDDLVCGNKPGESTRSTDCVDSGPGASAINPGAAEICDTLDNDCDALVDDADPGRTGGSTWYFDADGDGYAGSATTLTRCTQPPGYSATATDCRDTGAGAAAVYPGAPEIPADGFDQDCDGKDHCYVDADLDTYGTTAVAAGDDLVCGNKPGESTRSTDCVDSGPGASAINPGAAEICDTLDNDCDTLVDDADPGRTGGSTWYFDADGDGYAGSATTLTRCTQPPGYSATATDCRDTGAGAAAVYPGAPEIPADGFDQDCDGKDHCYVDADLDTYGTTAAAAGDDLVCGNRPGESSRSTDCVDSGAGAAAINPGAAEICDTLDNDCDTLVDDADPGRTGGTTWYADLDLDGHAGTSSTTTACTLPGGFFAAADDCRDAGPGAASIHPGAPEVAADGVDQDCDGKDHCFVDLDLDGYGTLATAAGDDLVCGDLPGESTQSTDCADAGSGAVDIHPGAAEVCNGVDDDCDLLTDDADPDRSGGSVWFQDADGDGFAGSTASLTSCAAPPGYQGTPSDCLDAGPGAAAVHPGATEVPVDGVDQDCDMADHCFVDLDGDGHGGPGTAAGDDLVCGNQPGEAQAADDCLDVGAGASEVYPGAVEVCNGVDDDCDLLIDGDDPDHVGGLTWYLDLDGDGFAGAVSTVVDCSPPPGAQATATDCLDVGAGASAIYPGAAEVPVDGVDQDCDGVDHCYVDGDLDGFGGPVAAAGDDLVCGDIPGESTRADDCVDGGAGASSIYPGAPEICDGFDNDCDLLVDDADAGVTGLSLWYGDADGDGYSGTGLTASACVAPPGYTAVATDCDDSLAAVSPAGQEACNGYDDDCDTLVDGDDVIVLPLMAWRDRDLDGYGDVATPVALPGCEEQPGAVFDSSDCDDQSADVYPGAQERPYDGVDQDCDGADLDDVDGDGFAGGVAGDDCVDVDPGVRPGAGEVADGVDDDCDGLVDDGTDWYDDDGDGVSEEGGDCDDADADHRPGGVEICDGSDDDCDGTVDDGTACHDDDGDGYTEEDGDCNDADSAIRPGAPEIVGSGFDADCDGHIDRPDDDGDGYAVEGGDCDDADPDRHPGAAERPDGFDDDCDDRVDEGTDVKDDDLDGYAEVQGDCNDDDAFINPGTVEIPGNGRDDDCDGVMDEGGSWVDDDGDGFTDDAGDCDDTDPTVFPYAEERANDIDDDCDGRVDEEAEDRDDDGWTAAQGDCNDGDGWSNPDADEQCDGVDNNCDGVADEGCLGHIDPKDPKPEPTSCGCDGAPAPWSLALVAALVLRRRRMGAAAGRRRGGPGSLLARGAARL